MNLPVRVIAPIGRDSELIASVLHAHRVPAQISTIGDTLSDAAGQMLLGPLLIAEEALSPPAIQGLSQHLKSQPSWSDLPLLILTAAGRDQMQVARPNSAWLPLGSPVLLERPIRTATLVSGIQAAVRARERQYQMRDMVAELKQERESLGAMLDNLPVGVVFAKSSGEIVRGNRRLEEILRHPLRHTQGADHHREWRAFHEDGRQVSGEEFPLMRAIRTGKAVPSEDYLYERGDGTRAWIRLAAAPVMNESGEVTGGVVALSDIDQQRRSEQALIQSEKLAAVGRLAASISHEINNPLEAVTNLLYLIRNSEGLSTEICNYLAAADGELSRVSQIVSQTLQFHRQSTKPRPISAGELLEPTLGLYAGRLANANIGLEVQHKGSILVTCYEGEIRQVLNNLVGNAVDSMKRGGRLLVRTRNTRLWRTDVTGMRITIADNGHGIPQETVQRIFDAFFTTKGINGTGLGLWIAKGIVDKHRGRLQVSSKVGVEKSGTVFSLFLPENPF